MKVQTFEYEPLPTPTSIRVVTLLHGESDITVFGVPLTPLSIQVVDLKDNPRFQALSYTWGSPFPPDLQRSKDYSPKNKFPVAINGEIFFLTRNLFEFLQRLKTQELYIDRRTKPYNKTRLIEAAEAGSVNDVYFWMARGADLAAQDKFGETALHYAAENGYLEVVKILVEAGSDLYRRDSTGRTPLDCARMRKRRRYAEIIEYLERPDINHIVGSKPRPLSPIDNQQFWIDAICINQDDIAERNAQVAIMSMIYTKASGVFVWLGVDDESTMRAFEATHLPSQEGIGMWYNDVLQNHVMEDPETRVAKQGSNETSLKYQAVVNLFRRTWFQRVWIIQEIALANQIRIFCGGIEFEYHKLFILFHNPNFVSRFTSRSLAQALELARWRGIGGSEVSTLTDIRLRTSKHVFERTVMVEYVKKNGISLVPTWEHKLSLSLLASKVWPFRATDPRDKVFALLGLSRLSDGPQRRIIADYTKSTSEVFIHFAKIFMQGASDEPLQTWHTGECEVFECLEGLSFVQESPDVSRRFDGQALPSWVPNFTAPLITTRLWSPRFRAGVYPDSSAAILPHHDPQTLRLNGAFHDEIVSVEPQIGTLTATSFRPPNWLGLISSMDKTYLPTGQNRVEALWRTLMTNKLSSTSDDPVHNARSSFRFFMQKALWSLTHQSDEETITNLKLVRETDENNTLPTWEEIQQYGAKDEVGEPRGMVRIDDHDFDQTFVHFYRGRLLYRTKRGYIGLGPWSVQAGDEVWVIAGARTPFVLRKSLIDNSSDTERRSLIGETYVHGIMDGELISSAQVFKPVSLV
ncbi:heterokaryon incompatibility protein-domain-containing protein [Aspergillus pseudonomiae]|uniref:Heterokaryon incompatibility protein-domain-containing protein n=1 Tax=Aspergillus pseudonomiae TaxID=1506151 RepID=A0A5N6IF13_9EURO|nr:heterokaryon incompatibility protein-domain-containing protein [Aspergillus pseudonomiae]KAB8263633.1 heterokaryon incompatibility protein-domain-containing protein [Aspergillus pseudonomiae]KAE8408497.1 heterokaryon incompatibility protein-domain-containing protein [Aspergillus pseudonomiae]